MSLLDSLSDLVKGATTGNASPAEIHSAYDQVAASVPQSILASGITHAFNSDQTPPFEQMISNLFGQSNPDQKAGILNQILASLGPNAVSQILGAAGAGGLSGGSITPEQAQQVSPATVQVLAQHAAKSNPSIIDMAGAFYAAHPTLVKAIGAGALALLMSHISQSSR